MNSHPLRVLLVTRSLPCHVRGGLEFHTVDLAIGLRGLGVEADLLSTEAPADYRRMLHEAHGIELHELQDVAPGVYTRDYFRRIGGAIERVCTGKRYDIVHGQEFGFGFWRPPRGFSATLALTVHGTITSETALHPDLFSRLGPAGKLRALRRYGRRLFYYPSWRRWLERADLILVDSDFTLGELKKIRPSVAPKVHKVPLGVRMEDYPEIDPAAAREKLVRDWGWSAGAEETNLITVGRLEWQKGHDVALRALADLKQFPWRYWIVGEGSARGDLERLSARLGLEGRVMFTGRVSAEDKAFMLSAADLFIWPERTHPAFGLVGLESMLMNTPVAGTRRGAIPESIGPLGGVLFDADNPRALAAALRPLLEDPGRLEALAKDLRRRTLERFAPEAMARKTLAAYRSVVTLAGS